MLSRQFVLFALTGGLAAVANFGSRIVFSLAMPYAPAIVLAYLVGLVTAFVLYKRFVFQAVGSGRTVRESVWFVVVNALAMLQTLVISIGLVDYGLPAIAWTWRPHETAHAVGVLFPVFSSFLGHKYLTFKKAAPCA